MVTRDSIACQLRGCTINVATTGAISIRRPSEASCVMVPRTAWRKKACPRINVSHVGAVASSKFAM